MQLLTIIIFSAIAVLTLGLLIYVQVWLPNEVHNKLADSLKAISTAIELRFPSHRGLSNRTVELSLLTGAEIKLSRKRLRDLEVAAYLRDIGLCAIPYRLVNEKALGTWNEADKVTYGRHADVSGAMLELVPSLRHVARIVRCHHAAYDGSTGPFYPAKDNIPIEARILAAVTEYAWIETHQSAIVAKFALSEGRGTKRDPKIVDALVRVLISGRASEARDSDSLAEKPGVAGLGHLPSGVTAAIGRDRMGLTQSSSSSEPTS